MILGTIPVLLLYVLYPFVRDHSCNALTTKNQAPVQYQAIEALQEHGIAANDIQKLQNAGYHTVESVRICFGHPVKSSLTRCPTTTTSKFCVSTYVSSFIVSIFASIRFDSIDCPCHGPETLRCQRDFRSQSNQAQRNCQGYGVHGI